jgi:hypothetical protein
MITADCISTLLPLNDDAVAAEVDNKVKTKLLSMWNNVKYGLSDDLQITY